jgi:hypothetical protein
MDPAKSWLAGASPHKMPTNPPPPSFLPAPHFQMEPLKPPQIHEQRPLPAPHLLRSVPDPNKIKYIAQDRHKLPQKALFP